ncbi:hypothetical protein D3C87_1409610 [compost metagenome]
MVATERFFSPGSVVTYSAKPSEIVTIRWQLFRQYLSSAAANTLVSLLALKFSFSNQRLLSS